MSVLANGTGSGPNVSSGPKTKLTVVLGAQWGDEGKGKLVDILATQADLVCRCQGGNNAGHTVVVGDKHYDFHMLPSGLINPKAMNVIGNGVVIHVPQLFEELEKNEAKGITDWKERLLVSDRAHLVFDLHQSADAMREGGKGSLGTTKKGIGPAYASKAQRHGLRVADLVGNYKVFSDRFRDLVSFYKRVFPDLTVDVEKELEKYKGYAERLRPIVCDSVGYVNNALQDKDKNIVVEGANATMLDIDFGTYPYVTSSNCSIGAVCTGLGVPPHAIGTVIGVIKAYTTRVGIGAFPTELDNELGQELRDRGHEYGVTTKRPRRCGWLDVVMLKFVHMINGFTSLVVGKMDVMDTFEEIKIGVAYRHKGKLLTSYPSTQEVLGEVEVDYITLPGWKTCLEQCRTFSELHPNAQAFIKKVEELSGIPVQWIGVGQARDAMIKMF